jgi:selenocysteine-specific elongation factor
MRTAINVPDVPLDQIKRGDVATIPGLGEPGSGPVVFLEKSSRPQRESRAVAFSIRSGSLVYLHHGTSRISARIALPGSGVLEAGQRKVAQLKLSSPIFAFVGDRFVIRDSAEQNTIAGGVVLDPDGHKESLTSSPALDEVDSIVRLTTLRRGFARQEGFLSKSQFSADEISESLMRLQQRNEIILREHIVANGEWWQRLIIQAAELIDEAHKENPECAGVDLTAMRSALRVQQADVIEQLVTDLCAGDFIRKGSVIGRSSHRPELPIRLQPIAEKIRQALSNVPFDPPSRREIESDPEARQVIRFFIDSGDLIEIAPEIILLRESFERMKSGITDFISKSGPATISQLRQALGSSRRIMVPLLERLDRDGFTRRLADKRTICKTRTS